MGELVGADEVGEMLGRLSRQRVSQITAEPDFPKPIATLKMGRVWLAEDVRRWARDHGRDIGETGDTGSAQ